MIINVTLAECRAIYTDPRFRVPMNAPHDVVSDSIAELLQEVLSLDAKQLVGKTAQLAIVKKVSQRITH